MSDDDTQLRRPVRQIHDAQEHCYRWHERCLRIHHGVIDLDRETQNVAFEPAVRMYHTALMTLWKQLERFRDEATAEDLWTKEIITFRGEEDPTLSELIAAADDIHKVTLADARAWVDSKPRTAITLETLGDYYRFKRDEEPVTVANPDGGSQPRRMDLEQCLIVHRQLDDVVRSLGLDANLEEPVAGLDAAEV